MEEFNLRFERFRATDLAI